MISEVRDQILNQTCGNSLREAIKKENFALRELDILILAYKYAPDYNKRLELLSAVEKSAEEPQIREWAKRLIRHEKHKFEMFVAFKINTVFEVLVDEESYLAKSYNGALKKLQQYDCGQISKRKIDDSCEEDELGICFFENGVLTDINFYEKDDDEIETQKLVLPKFIKNLDIISHGDYYSVALDCDDDGAAILDFDDIYDARTKEEFDVLLDESYNLGYPMIEKINILDIPEEIRKAYMKFLGLYKMYNK